MTYVFDIDGTICSLTPSKYEEAEPFPERIEKINSLYDQGHTIIFQTARGWVGAAILLLTPMPLSIILPSNSWTHGALDIMAFFLASRQVIYM